MSESTLPIDTSVQVPAAVRRAAEAAESLHKQAYEGAPEGNSEGNGQPPEGDKGLISIAPTSLPADTPPPKETTEPPQKSSRPPAQQEVPEEQWQHRYNSMKGRYDTLNGQVQALVQRMTEIERENQNLRTVAQRGPQQQQQPQQRQPQRRFVTDEEEKDYGREFLDVVGRKAREIATPEVTALQGKIQQLEGRLSQVGAHITYDAQSRMYQHLDERLPNWRDINHAPEFIQWLGLPDLYSGGMRRDLLRRAYEQNDTPRVAAFFEGFLREVEALSPAQRDQPDQAKVPLENLAAPGRAKATGASQAPGSKPFFTRDQIAKFYSDSANGRWAGREKEKDAMERQISLAINEGRIRS